MKWLSLPSSQVYSYHRQWSVMFKMCPPTTGSPSNAKFKVDGALVLLPRWTVHDPTKLNRWQLSTGVALPTYVRFSSLHLPWMGLCALCHGIQNSIEVHFGLPPSSIHKLTWLVDRNIELQRFAQSELHQEETSSFFQIKLALSEALKLNIPVYQSCQCLIYSPQDPQNDWTGWCILLHCWQHQYYQQDPVEPFQFKAFHQWSRAKLKACSNHKKDTTSRWTQGSLSTSLAFKAILWTTVGTP